jgi:hypothetical protein
LRKSLKKGIRGETFPIELRKKIFDAQWDEFISNIDQKPFDRDIVLYYLTISQNIDWEYIRKGND